MSVTVFHGLIIGGANSMPITWQNVAVNKSYTTNTIGLTRDLSAAITSDGQSR